MTNQAPEIAAIRLKALLAENERLKTQNFEEYCEDMHEYHCPRIPRWVSVEERLPEKTGLCITFGTETPKIWLNNFDADLGKFGVWFDYEPDGTKHPHYCFLDSIDISHWMPLPEPPSTEGVA